MKYGFVTPHRNDRIYILYFFINGEIIEPKEQTNTFDSILLKNDTLIFSNDIKKLDTCDKKILVTHSNWWNKPHTQTNIKCDKLIAITPGETVPLHVTDKQIIEFLDQGNILITGSTLNIQHKNLICDFSLNLFYFYCFFGFTFLNYYPNSKKNSLLGMYYSTKHISNERCEVRDIIYNKTIELVGDDLTVFSYTKHKFDNILTKYTGVGLWDRNHISSYLDYNNCVCNIVFETFNVTHSFGHIPEREHITEKTLKTLLFAEAKIFFILYTSQKQVNYLRSKGLWVLNFEFLKEDPSYQDILDSVIESVRFLKKLKEELKTDENVYNFLLDKYSDKLQSSLTNLKMLLNNAPDNISDQLLDLIRTQNEKDRQNTSNGSKWIHRLAHPKNIIRKRLP